MPFLQQALDTLHVSFEDIHRERKVRLDQTFQRKERSLCVSQIRDQVIGPSVARYKTISTSSDLA